MYERYMSVTKLRSFNWLLSVRYMKGNLHRLKWYGTSQKHKSLIYPSLFNMGVNGVLFGPCGHFDICIRKKNRVWYKHVQSWISDLVFYLFLLWYFGCDIRSHFLTCLGCDLWSRISPVWDVISGLISDLTCLGCDLWSDLGSHLFGMWSLVWSRISPVWGVISGLISDLTCLGCDLWSDLGSHLFGMWSLVWSQISPVWDVISGLISDLTCLGCDLWSRISPV